MFLKQLFAWVMFVMAATDLISGGSTGLLSTANIQFLLERAMHEGLQNVFQNMFSAQKITQFVAASAKQILDVVFLILWYRWTFGARSA